ncbi:universal stress protein [Kitasatospora sp. NPDC059673]|uniref:universal stress protein n=1 Tax=Kitasatospora sp. NPDC059673 TaxID=3346901 RepID=UPI0036BFC9DF
MAATDQGRSIVLGVDALGENDDALRWAADEAAHRGLPLRMIHVVQPSPRSMRVLGTAFQQDQVRVGRRQLHLAGRLARARHRELEVSAEIQQGAPGPVLVHVSREAAFVVLGSRSLSRIEELLSGYSITVPVSAQAHCPVVVVPQRQGEADDPPRLVVGVDGSPSSAIAFAAALELARHHGATVHAVWVWQRPRLARLDEEATLDELRRTLDGTTAGPRAENPDVAVTSEVVSGHPVRVLADESRHALAVVIGRRGSGGFTGMRLGSVPRGLLHEASCPVVTVPGAPDRS